MSGSKRKRWWPATVGDHGRRAQGVTAFRMAKQAKWLLIPAMAVPGIIAYFQYCHGIPYCENDIEALTSDTGQWGVRMLMLSLTITPLRDLTCWNWLITYRRPLGLASFYYLATHFAVFLYLDFALDLEFILVELTTSLYVVVGFVAFLLLLPLAITSTNGWIRALGKKWRVLHALVYGALFLGVLHYLLQIKEIGFWLYFYMILGSVLLAYRIVKPVWRALTKRSRA